MSKDAGPAPNALVATFEPAKQFYKNAKHLIQRCTKPDGKGIRYVNKHTKYVIMSP